MKVSAPMLLIAAASMASATASVPALRRHHRDLQAWELPDWAQAWVDEATANTDWSSPTAWQEWFSGVQDEANLDGLDLCPLLEAAVGMGQMFGIAAQCDCTGDIMTSLDIQCQFQQCVPVTEVIDAITAEQRQSNNFDSDNAICGNVAMNMTFGGDLGSVATSVCADFPTEEIQETCFSYSFSMVPGETPTQTCGASYGDQECDCSIDNFCLNMNCSSILPGAEMDTCQMLAMQTDADLLSWIPQFDMFQPGFELDADAISWQSLDWDNLDWANFNVSDIDWSSPEWLEESWSNLVGGVSEGVSDGVCTLMTMAAQLTEELGAEGGCACSSENGLSIECDFAEICVGEEIDVEPVCSSVNMTFDFDTLAGIDSTVCMDFFGDSHPKTCFSYTLPVADQFSAPTCTATYGEGTCECSIDENLCILVDCSEFEESARMDTCQIVDTNGAIEASRFALPFEAPVADESSQPSGENVIDVQSSEQLADAGSGSAVTSAALSVVAISLAVLSYF